MRDPEPTGGQSGGAAGTSALRTSIALDGDGTAIAHARRMAVAFLTRAQSEHGVRLSQRGMDLTQLVVSELVTNARKYAPGPARMDLSIDGDVVEVAVWDSDPVLPVARAADAGRVGQHGLEIVMAVSQDFSAQREDVGKRITARIGLADDTRTAGADTRTAAAESRPAGQDRSSI
ncbi:ATP-binding protein [Streptomyces sp. NPDC101117]|uniref:ATP-binding protein n=1 Tax=Streptomyces sp. NPDC101117 TaxID=3366108 RepID=UPI003815930D